MTNFRTKFPSFEANFKINYQSRLLSLGSCFAEHIGNRLQELKFATCLNPFGILYNPASIQNALEILLENRQFTALDIFEHEGLWHSFAHHGSFSKTEKSAILNAINNSISEANIFLQTTDRLIITLGTANVFVWKKSGEIVANCHKWPNTDFDRKRLSVEEIISGLTYIFKKIKKVNPALEIIMTVSPVRHIRDGLVENQRSKATLLLAVDVLEQQLDFVHYFPSYEIVLDDLRDYRFFKEDLIHPTDTAINYIWQYFDHAYFNEETRQLNLQIGKIVQASQHRPLHPDTEGFRIFKENQLERISQLEEEFPFLDFEKEKKVFTENEE